MLLGVDVGGTFTDAVLIGEGLLVTGKAPTTPEDQSRGVLNAVGQVLRKANATADQIERFAHGMTVATNALLEGRAARAALIVTAGFTDIVELARQNRPHLYRLCERGPAPLVGPELRFAAAERMGPDGVITPLTETESLARSIAAAGVESVAVVLLHSYRHPAHEQAVFAALTGAAPDVSVHLSSELVGTFREYERAATTELDAALSPLLASYLRGLSAGCAEAGLPEPSIMQSNGGLIDLDRAARHAALTVMSGPAGGAAGAAFAARLAGASDVLCFDMGGTSCDVCVVDGGQVAEQGSATVAGRPVALPALAVHTVGAGGGSVAWADAGGALRVGPRSAGAVPGPACYGRGGTEPTVTDANVVLGFLDPAAPLAGGLTLDRSAARKALAGLAAAIGLTVEECALGIRRVAAAEMAAALRVVTVDRGVDPRNYALLSCGGAGALHATDVADELGIGSVIVPGAAGVLAALGLVVAPQRRDTQKSVIADLTAVRLAEQIDALVVECVDLLCGPAAKLVVTLDLRYRGQSFELPIKAAQGVTAEQAREAFEAEHQARYAYVDPSAPVELVTLRVSAFGESPEVPLARTDRRELRGPTVLRLPETTVLVPAGWSGEIDETGTIQLGRG